MSVFPCSKATDAFKKFAEINPGAIDIPAATADSSCGNPGTDIQEIW